jgi:hypothetical protein
VKQETYTLLVGMQDGDPQKAKVITVVWSSITASAQDTRETPLHQCSLWYYLQ